ncbi:MAG TPA: tetratricopeptide repeat protein [Anaerolineae bacterium]|nr:tetratricopeptide repeat protein [Anaerolineae bacterium]
MLSPGQKLFEYEITQRIGEGGFATVYEAYDRLLDRRVAIKQLHLKRVEERKAVQRFLQEARINAALEHPNIVTIHGLRLHQNQFYMIMEFLPGGTLQTLLETHGKLPVERAVDLTIGICDGLAKFHEQGVIHRDIKPTNIMLTADGRPKVIDFGIAHVPEAMGGLNLTEVGFQPSTLVFSSPEQVLGQALDTRSDVYQIGELLYYMLAGEHYIDLARLEQEAETDAGTNRIRMQAKLYTLLEQVICEEVPAGLKKLWREVGALAGVVEDALAKDKMKRYKDAAEFAATLRTLSSNTVSLSITMEQHSLQEAMALNKRGLAHVSTRNYEQAIIDYTKAIQLDPQYAEAYNNRSTAHLMMGNYGQAVTDCTAAIDFAAEFVAAYVNRGIAYTGLRDFERAQADFAKAVALDPNNVYAFFNRGNAFLWNKQNSEAVGAFSQAIKLDPEFVAAYVNRGVAYTELRRYEPALADCSQAIALNPDYVYAYYNRANLYRELRRYPEAIADYSKVIELNPEHPHVYENRGDAYAAIGDEAHATDDYTRTIGLVGVIQPRRLSIAPGMTMPATPLEFGPPRSP